MIRLNSFADLYSVLLKRGYKREGLQEAIDNFIAGYTARRAAGAADYNTFEWITEALAPEWVTLDIKHTKGPDLETLFIIR